MLWHGSQRRSSIDPKYATNSTILLIATNPLKRDTAIEADATAETRLLLAARRLFCREGIHATGISRLLKEANVARRTLYERYGSKENVLRAVFTKEADMWYAWFDTELSQRAADPSAKLLALFDLLYEWFDSGAFFGCIFVNAVAEHDKKGGWIQSVANRHTRNIDRRITALVKTVGIKDVRAVVDKISLLIDGAIVIAMVSGDPKAAYVAKSTAADILAAAGVGVAAVGSRAPALRKKTSRRAQPCTQT